MNLTKGIINLYENKEMFENEKNQIEIFLYKNFKKEFILFKAFKIELYVQLLSVLNQFDKEKEFEKIKENLRIISKLYKKIKNIESTISPALIFFPKINGSIINEFLIDIFLYHTENLRNINKKKIIEYGEIKAKYQKYPKKNILNFKPDLGDDIIGSYDIKLVNLGNTISQTAFYLGKDEIFISCIQNKKIGLENLQLLRNITFKKYFLNLYFLINEFLNDKKYIIFPTNDSQVSRIYGNFAGNYDYLGESCNFEKIENGLFWKGEIKKLKNFLNKFNIEKYFKYDLKKELNEINTKIQTQKNSKTPYLEGIDIEDFIKYESLKNENIYLKISKNYGKENLKYLLKKVEEKNIKIIYECDFTHKSTILNKDLEFLNKKNFHIIYLVKSVFGKLQLNWLINNKDFFKNKTLIFENKNKNGKLDKDFYKKILSILKEKSEILNLEEFNEKYLGKK